MPTLENITPFDFDRMEREWENEKFRQWEEENADEPEGEDHDA